MTQGDDSRALPPRAAFRVGVSGERRLAPDQLERLQQLVAELLATIAGEVDAATTAPAARGAYAAAGPLLTLVSPLGDGADRLVAGEALRQDRWELAVPLPFPRAQYETTFLDDTSEQHAASVAEFDALLARSARILTLDGDTRDEAGRPLAYEAVGHLVVRNCDLLIAIWDDERVPHGRGGTTDTVQYALRAGVPVWWIHSTKPVPPRWLADDLDLPGVGLPPPEPRSAEPALRDYLARTMLPPRAQGGERLWNRLLGRLRPLRVEEDPLSLYFAEAYRPNLRIWGAHQAAMRYLRGDAAGPDRASRPRGSVLRLAPRRGSSLPARLSDIYQQRYRSSYLFVFAAAAVALISTMAGLAFEAAEIAATWFELAALGVILLLVCVNQTCRWYERYVAYRLLGEVLRMSGMLRRLGWALPGARVRTAAGSRREGWVAWLFAATERATPLLAADPGGPDLVAARDAVATGLIEGQLAYHRRRIRECERATAVLTAVGTSFFGLTLALVLLRLAVAEPAAEAGYLTWMSLAGGVLAAFAAAVFSIRAYEEFEVLAHQSHRLVAALEDARSRIGRIDLTRPLASDRLARELSELAAAMLDEVSGWAQLFRARMVEA